jgi:hypothetical protein
MIEEICTKYKFTYTILPLESILDTKQEIVDLRQPTPQEKDQLLEEKKNDFDNHTKLDEEMFAQVRNTRVQIDDLGQKREHLKQLIGCLPPLSNFREDLIWYMKKLVISEFCLKYNFKKALFGTNSHKIATNLL